MISENELSSKFKKVNKGELLWAENWQAFSGYGR